MHDRRALVVASLGATLCLLAGAPALAQRALTLDEALALAREHNRELRASRARIEQSATGVEQALAALLPRVAVQGRYTHNYKTVSLDLGQQLAAGVLGLAEAIRSTSENEAEVGAIDSFERALLATASQPIELIKGEQLTAALNVDLPIVVPSAYPGLAAARLTHAASVESLAATEADVLLAVARAYYAAAGADELLVARANAEAIATQSLEHAKVRARAGAATEVEVSRAEVAAVRAGQAVAEAGDAQARAYRALATLLGTREAFTAAGLQAQAGPAEPPDEATLVEGALRLRPELASYQHQLEAAASTARSSAWRWAPTLSAFGTVQGFNYQGFSGDYYSWAVGLQLDWTVYDGGVRDAQRRRAWAQHRELAARLELLRDTVTDGVVEARRALGTRRRALEAALRAAALSRETLRLVRAQYEAGAAMQLELLQAQDSLVSADVAVAQERFALALADLQLRREAGLFPTSEVTP